MRVKTEPGLIISRIPHDHRALSLIASRKKQRWFQCCVQEQRRLCFMAARWQQLPTQPQGCTGIIDERSQRS